MFLIAIDNIIGYSPMNVQEKPRLAKNNKLVANSSAPV
jgi:hypothetical protein